MIKGFLSHKCYSLFSGLVLACFLLFSSVLQAEGEAQSSGSSPGLKDDDLLDRMSKAFSSLNYQGRFIYRQGSDIHSLNIAHAVYDGVEFERLTQLDGPKFEVLRLGDQVMSVHPIDGLTSLTREGVAEGFSSRFSAVMADKRFYLTKVTNQARIAGRAAKQLQLIPKDIYRFAYRLWLDDATGLLLKSELLDGSGNILELFEFVSLQTGVAIPKSTFSLSDSEDRNVVELNPSSKVGVGATRILVPWLPGGFELVGRSLRASPATSELVQVLMYSDGVSAFTLMVEIADNFQEKEAVVRMGATVGMSRWLSEGKDSIVVTLIGEVPLAAAVRVVDAITPKG